jgi:hypothetical protein
VSDPTGTGPDASGSDESDALLLRLGVIEGQPLEERAEAYAHVHEELQRRLEGGDARRVEPEPDHD